jgi:hypothetical protein
VAPGQFGSPSVHIKSDPLNPGGYRAYPVLHSPAAPRTCRNGLVMTTAC